MMTLNRNMLAVIVMVLTAPLATAQYSNTNLNSNYGCATGGCNLSGYENAQNSPSRPTYSSQDTYTNNGDYRSDYRLNYNTRPNNVFPPIRTYTNSDSYSEQLLDRYQTERSRLQLGYDYRAPLNDMVDNSFRTPLTYSNQDRGRDLHDRYDSRGRLPDPFQLPTTNRSRNDLRYQTTPLSRQYHNDRDPSFDNYQSRYRIPLEQVDYSTPMSDFRPNLRSPDRFKSPIGNRYDVTTPSRVNDQRLLQRGLDPFTPPLPRRDTDNELESIRKAISSRYSSPVNVRAVRSMSANQSLALFREVSEQTDGRHLEPSSYDLRIRRGIRNLGLALENPVFTESLGVQADSFRVDGFRTTLSRIAERMQVSNISDAQQVVQSVMREAQAVPGLTPSIVGFEFANATIDTLDKFSALEPKEPGRGAALELDGPDKLQTAGLESEIVGIGVEIKGDAEGLLVVKALRGGPAAEAGLRSGDIITAIDGRSIRGMALANSVDLMKGNAGSRIQLQIVRNGSRGTNVTLVRRSVRLYTVNDAKIMSGSENVAYISLSQFGQKSTEELDQALNQMHSKGMKSLILDLRGNPGGLLNICVDITNRFLPCGTIVSTRGRLSSDNMVETATFNRTWSTPLVVLIDGDSASASEIFAAAVQDNQRGIVIGERSYGKGTVQTHFPLSSVNGNLRLTTARFYSPNGRPMSGDGVTPDVRVADADGVANGDRVLNEAIVIAQSQRLKDIAQAARQCRPAQGRQLQRNSFKGNIYDPTAPKTVIR